MRIYIYIYIYIYMCIYIYVYIYIYIYMCCIFKPSLSPPAEPRGCPCGSPGPPASPQVMRISTIILLRIVSLVCVYMYTYIYIYIYMYHKNYDCIDIDNN